MRAAEQLGPLAHRDDAEAARRGPASSPLPWSSTSSSRSRLREAQPHPGPVGAGMPRHVVERLLQHAVDVNRRRCRPPARAAPVRSYDDGDAELLFDGREIPVDRALEPELLEDRRMQRLREAAHVVERRLRDLADLAQLGAERRALRRTCCPGPPEHRARSPSGSGRTRRAARARSGGASTRGPRSAAAPARGAGPRARRARANSRRFDRIRYRLVSHDRDERGGEEPVHLPLHLVVDLLDPLRRLLLAFVVLDQQARHRRAQRRLARLERQAGSARARLPRSRPAPARRSGRRHPRTARPSVAR